jgi:uncharacterized LabA/DUF88 family protein/cold shock CspA family protein
MIRAGIFLDMQNLMLNGGRRMQVDVLRSLVQARGGTIIRANAYFAIDEGREKADDELRQRNQDFRNAIRRSNYHLVLKTLKRYRDDAGEETVKANVDLEMAVDALVQSESLDYVLLGTGDGDFVRLVRALANRGKWVEVLSFGNTNSDLMTEADSYTSGFLVPDLTPAYPADAKRWRGFLHHADTERGYGFATVYTGVGPEELRQDVFCHISQFRDRIDNETFGRLKTQERILDFEIEQKAEDKIEATDIKPLDWQSV